MFDPKPLWMQRWRNSIHVAIRLKVRRVFLRTAGPAPNKSKNVQNRGNTANVARSTQESIFHAGMIVGQDFNPFAHTPQSVNFQQKVFESRSDCRSIGFRVYCVHCGCGQLCLNVNLKTQIFYQAQRCCLAKKGEKQPEQMRNQIDSHLAVLLRVRLGFNFVEPAQTSIRRYLHGAESGKFRLGQSQGTGSENLKTVSAHRCTELSAQPLIHAHSCRFSLQGGRGCVGFRSNEAAGQITRLLWRNHRVRSFFTCYASP